MYEFNDPTNSPAQKIGPSPMQQISGDIADLRQPLTTFDPTLLPGQHLGQASETDD